PALIERASTRAVALLERALTDASYDVRRAAIPGLARAYARASSCADLEGRAMHTEDRAALRLALLQALALQTASAAGGTAAAGRGEAAGGSAGAGSAAARAALERIARAGPPLARLQAALVLAFAGPPGELDGFLADLTGG